MFIVDYVSRTMSRCSGGKFGGYCCFLVLFLVGSRHDLFVLVLPVLHGLPMGLEQLTTAADGWLGGVGTNPDPVMWSVPVSPDKHRKLH